MLFRTCVGVVIILVTDEFASKGSEPANKGNVAGTEGFCKLVACPGDVCSALIDLGIVMLVGSLAGSFFRDFVFGFGYGIICYFDKD